MSMVNEHPPIVKLSDPLFTEHGVELFVYQLYHTHPTISGNKWFKLKYNLQEAKRLGVNTILTFGGAYSNHIHATAAACKEFGLKSISIIRGERSGTLNSTLTFAESCGMQLHFIDRETYKSKNTEAFVEKLRQQFGKFYLIPEGGSNLLGVKGCTEIMEAGSWRLEVGKEDFDFVCCACGTGATLAGITLSLKSNQKALGFSVLKGGEFLHKEVGKFMMEYNQINTPLPTLKLRQTNPLTKGDYNINIDYHFGGYAKVTPQLIEFAKKFEKQHKIPLDYIYTAKMFFGLYDLIHKKDFKKGSKIIALHTGGLQGNKGFKE